MKHARPRRPGARRRRRRGDAGGGQRGAPPTAPARRTSTRWWRTGSSRSRAGRGRRGPQGTTSNLEDLGARWRSSGSARARFARMQGRPVLIDVMNGMFEREASMSRSASRTSPRAGGADRRALDPIDQSIHGPLTRRLGPELLCFGGARRGERKGSNSMTHPYAPRGSSPRPHARARCRRVPGGRSTLHGDPGDPRVLRALGPSGVRAASSSSAASRGCRRRCRRATPRTSTGRYPARSARDARALPARQAGPVGQRHDAAVAHSRRSARTPRCRSCRDEFIDFDALASAAASSLDAQGAAAASSTA